jgi:ribA/ribD-fused uncharacterized protein
MGKHAPVGPAYARVASAAVSSSLDSTGPQQRKVIGFYGDQQGKSYREFSNFCRLPQPYEFNLPLFAYREGFPTSIWCSFSEKAIMATKAALMGDLEAFQCIDKVDDPKSCKALGRRVQHFDEQLWLRHLEDIAFEVVRQKFAACKAFREVLLSTGDHILAEAAPNDCVWGIGLPLSDDRVGEPDQWRGRNVLGYALMRARKHFQSASSQSREPTVVADVTSVAELPAEASGNTGLASPAKASAEPRARRWGKAAGQPKASEVAATDLATGSAAASNSSSSTTVVGSSPMAAAARMPVTPGKIDCFAVLDFEATCEDGVTWEPQEVIELPLVLVDAVTGAKVSEFRTYVRPVHRPRLTAFCTSLTGIQQSSVDGAPRWKEAFTRAQAWLASELARLGFQNCTLVTCGDWDLKTMLPKQCALSGEHVPECFSRWLNIKNFFQQVTGRPGKGMPHMLEALKLELQGHHHSGLDDSRNIARILQTLLQRGAVEEHMLSVSSGYSTMQRGKGKKGRGK